MCKRLLVMVLFSVLCVHSNDRVFDAEEYGHLDPEAARALRRFYMRLDVEDLQPPRRVPIEEPEAEPEPLVLVPQAEPTPMNHRQHRRIPQQRAQFLEREQQVPQRIPEEERERRLEGLNPEYLAWLRNNFTDHNPNIQELMKSIISFTRFAESVSVGETDPKGLDCKIYFADLINHIYACIHRFSETLETKTPENAQDLQAIYKEIEHCEESLSSDLNLRLRPLNPRRGDEEPPSAKFTVGNTLDTLKFLVYLKAKEINTTLADAIGPELTERDFNSVIKNFTTFTILDLHGRTKWTVGTLHLAVRSWFEKVSPLLKAPDTRPEIRRRGRR